MWVQNIWYMDIRYPGTRYLIFGDRLSGYQHIRKFDIRYADNQVSDMWISDMWVPDIRSLDINPTPGHFRNNRANLETWIPNIWNLDIGCPGTKYQKPADRISWYQISEIWIYQMSGYHASEILISDMWAPNIRNLDIRYVGTRYQITRYQPDAGAL